MAALFEFLFKYRPEVFSKGDLAFGAPTAVILLLLAGLAIGAPAVLTYAGVRGKSTRRDRWVLGTLRVLALVVLAVCLFRPMLLLATAVPQRNYVGILIDDSRSMQIADRGNRTRADFVRQTFGADSALLRDLSERFMVRMYAFSGASRRIASSDSLRFDGRETRLMDALEEARTDLESVPLAGLVVLTDGADNARGVIADRLLALRAHGVPIFTVGIGAERFDRDIEIRRVDAPRRVLRGSAFAVDVLVRQRGFGGARVPIVVEDGGRIVATDTVRLPADGEVAPVRVHITARDPGPRTLTFRIPLQRDEQVAQNNAQQALVDVREQREKVLYIEGEPRYETRFIRAAVDPDTNLQLVVLQRTAENKFLRLHVDDGEELAGGFPTTRAELFRYRAIVLGSIEASFFTHDQLAMLADFVSRRGGGLLFLGGPRSFAEGGYAGTPLADVMPVVIEGQATANHDVAFFADLRPQLRPAGANHAVTQVAETPARSVERWRTLPAVTSVNRIRRVKPGAVTLVDGSVPRAGRAGMPGDAMRDYAQPVLVYQRFGRGLSVALPIQDAWTWQMHADIPVEDMTHQTFWRQLLRWLASDVPEPVTVALSADQMQPRQPVVVRAEVADSQFILRNDARVTAQVRAPSGAVRAIPLEWAVDRDGEYRASFAPEEAGVHTVRVEAGARGASVAADSAFVRVADLDTEFFDAELRSSLLRRIADETGGRYYTPANIASLTEDLAISNRGVTVVDQMDLWDMPFNLLLLIGLVSAEWAYRRARGLA